MLHTAGFFRELRHGNPEGPSLREALQQPLDEGVRAQVAAYLRSGAVIAATTAQADDVLDPTRTAVSGICVRTDGSYAWSEDLAYYVETYGVAVPPGLVEAALAGEPPVLGPDERAKLAREFRESP